MYVKFLQKSANRVFFPKKKKNVTCDSKALSMASLSLTEKKPLHAITFT